MLPRTTTLLLGIFLIAAGVCTAADTTEPKKTSPGREQLLIEHGLSTGIADGRVDRFNNLRYKLSLQKSDLDRIYQVSHLYLDDGKLQPPVIATSENIYQQMLDGKHIDISQVRYQIVAPARFVTSQIDWYTYLVSDDDVAATGQSDDILTSPKTESEAALLKKMYQTGYEEGASQVDIEVQSRIKALTTLVTGMANYHILRKMNVVQAPQVTRLHTPVRGNATQLVLASTTSDLSRDAEFNLNAGTYKAYLDKKNPFEASPGAHILVP